MESCKSSTEKKDVKKIQNAQIKMKFIIKQYVFKKP